MRQAIVLAKIPPMPLEYYLIIGAGLTITVLCIVAVVWLIAEMGAAAMKGMGERAEYSGPAYTFG